MKLDQSISDGMDQAGFLRLSVLGGLTQFGAYVDTLHPGALSSERHWHDSEDEFLFMLDGCATLEDDDGLQPLEKGDAVCWPFGVANAHHLLNPHDKPCSFLIVGSRVARDRCHYPDSGDVQVNADTTWAVVDREGRVLRDGDLPPELLNLPERWGTRAQGPFPKLSRAAERQGVRVEHPPHPALGGGNGPFTAQPLSDPGGLSQFGVYLDTLPPGSRSGHRHWHENEDEMVVMLSGEVTLVEASATPLRAGEVACWPKGTPVGHCLVNEGPADARYLVLGTRKSQDVIHFPDHGLVVRLDGGARAWFHADGRPREG